MISLNELAIPIIGRSSSQSVKPSALSSERCGALSGPLVIKSLRFVIFFFLGSVDLGGVIPNPRFDIDSYGLLNLRVGATSPSGRYSLRLSVENATDEDYVHYVGSSIYGLFDGVQVVSMGV